MARIERVKALIADAAAFTGISFQRRTDHNVLGHEQR